MSIPPSNQVFNCVAPQSVIEKSTITVGSRGTYFQRLINLLLFIYDNQQFRDIIHNDLVPVFQEAETSDNTLPHHKARHCRILREAIRT